MATVPAAWTNIIRARTSPSKADKPIWGTVSALITPQRLSAKTDDHAAETKRAGDDRGRVADPAGQAGGAGVAIRPDPDDGRWPTKSELDLPPPMCRTPARRRRWSSWPMIRTTGLRPACASPALRAGAAGARRRRRDARAGPYLGVPARVAASASASRWAGRWQRGPAAFLLDEPLEPRRRAAAQMASRPASRSASCPAPPRLRHLRPGRGDERLPTGHRDERRVAEQTTPAPAVYERPAMLSPPASSARRR